MPQFDLRNGEKLTRLAGFKVLSVMCHPKHRSRREGMIDHVRVNSDVGGPHRRRPLSKEEFFSDLRVSSNKAVVAGGLLLTMIQLHRQEHPFSFNQATLLERARYPKWQQPSGNAWPRDSQSRSWPRSRRKVLDAWHEFRAVAHLWAALAHYGQHNDLTNVWRWVLQELPTFLAFADTILEMGSCVPSPHRDKRFVLTHAEAWRFLLPQPLIVRKPLLALPLHQDQLAVLQRAGRA